MRTLFIALAATVAFASCNGQSSAVKDQQGVYNKLDDMKKKVTFPTTEAGWTMTCLIDGQPFKASSIVDPPDAGRVTGQYKDGKIALPIPDFCEVGHKTDFSNSAVDFSPVGSPDFWGGHVGGMEITKVGGGWVEGNFHFTAKLMNSTKTMEITNGFFRITDKKR